METKFCRWCLADKPIQDFHNRSDSKCTKQSVCKECTKKYKKKHYRENKQQYITKNYRYRALLRAIVDKMKDRPCVDCDNKFPPYAMDFDHTGDDKVMDIAALVQRCSLKNLLVEIAKCEVVCAVCHRIRTHMRASSNGKMLSFQASDLSSILSVRCKVYDKETWRNVRQILGIPELPVLAKREPMWKKMIGPEGTVWCSRHKEFLPIALFVKNASNWNGYSRQCKECRKLIPSRISKKQAAIV